MIEEMRRELEQGPREGSGEDRDLPCKPRRRSPGVEQSHTHTKNTIMDPSEAPWASLLVNASPISY